MRLFRVGLLVTLIAAALMGVLWVTDVIPKRELGSVAGKTFGAIAIVFVAALVWRVVRGRASVYDHTDQPVP